MKKFLSKLNPKKAVDAILRRKIAATLVALALGLVGNHLAGHQIEVSNDVEKALVTLVEALINTALAVL